MHCVLSVEDFDEKTYNNNGESLESSRILRVKPNFLHFLSFSFIFCHVLSFSFSVSFFSFLFFFLFYCFFFLSGAQNFFGPQFRHDFT